MNSQHKFVSVRTRIRLQDREEFITPVFYCRWCGAPRDTRLRDCYKIMNDKEWAKFVEEKAK